MDVQLHNYEKQFRENDNSFSSIVNMKVGFVIVRTNDFITDNNKQMDSFNKNDLNPSHSRFFINKTDNYYVFGTLENAKFFKLSGGAFRKQIELTMKGFSCEVRAYDKMKKCFIPIEQAEDIITEIKAFTDKERDTLPSFY